MKVTKEQAQQNRQALLEAAGALFKEHGIGGVGVAEVCQQAGLTHGALYKHFADKQDLAAQAFTHVFDTSYARIKSRPRTLDTYLNAYLSQRTRDDMSAGCPLISTACDTGRQGEPVSRSFTDAFTELRSGIESVLPSDGPAGDKAALASTLVAALMGAMALSRGVVKADRELANEVLAHVRSVLEAVSAPSEPA